MAEGYTQRSEGPPGQPIQVRFLVPALLHAPVVERETRRAQNAVSFGAWGFKSLRAQGFGPA